MAFLDASDYQVIPSTKVERRFHTILGAQSRNVTEYRLTWAIDDSGGESPPATYSGADLQHHGPEIAYGGANGLYVAIYRSEGAWA
ncbi:MAG: hypothetical protein HN742_30445 [Lentisphaerae bacterium]|jgi:hypothetical protein|nr:hypothetical protein [Lentisphaerota bacterium]MBT7059789.1 hypothetical protein [Lentisphaerota bacterium]MBT7846232.1 hypothetical protein [Lentisphaerota bacterium]